MKLGAPLSLSDVIVDGVFVSAAADLAFEEALGRIFSVEFNFRGKTAKKDGTPTLDEPVDVRIASSKGVRDVRGHRVAIIDKTRWIWSTAAIHNLKLPEFTEFTDYSPALLKAARTLVAGRPILIAEQNSHLAAVALDFRPTGVPDREALCRGLTQMPYNANEERALTAYAVATGRSAISPAVSLANGYIDHIHVEGQGALTLPQVTADAHYLAAEQQLFYSGRFPGAQIIDLDLNTGRARVSSAAGTFEAAAHVIATVSTAYSASTMPHTPRPAPTTHPAPTTPHAIEPANHVEPVWTWAWADPGLNNSAAQKASFNLCRFGADNGIAAFLRPQMPAGLARSLRLAQAAMPVLGVWTLDSVELTRDVSGIVLLDSPTLALPPLTDAVHTATLRVPLPDGIDENRARMAYAIARNV